CLALLHSNLHALSCVTRAFSIFSREKTAAYQPQQHTAVDIFRQLVKRRSNHSGTDLSTSSRFDNLIIWSGRLFHIWRSCNDIGCAGTGRDRARSFPLNEPECCQPRDDSLTAAPHLIAHSDLSSRRGDSVLSGSNE